MSWTDFYQATLKKPVHPLFHELEAFLPSTPGHALDVGCGVGNATLWLLDRGWRVTAFDPDPEALEILRERASGRAGFDGFVAPVQTAPLESVDLVVAQFCLFFLPESEFDDAWNRLLGTVRPGGLAMGQLLGPNDDWAGERITHTPDQVESLLNGFDILYYEEADRDGETALGEAKHWHVHHWIARRRETV